MRYRQVHLDFHTAGSIEGIGLDFDPKAFQQTLLQAHVNSVTLTAKCAHGWMYYDSRLSPRHPNLSFDLLSRQIEAAHAVGIKTPVHLSIGLDEREVRNHPEWLIRRSDEKTTWVPTLMEAGWHRFCLNNAHTQAAIEQVLEVAEHYDVDGLFLDVSSPIPCCCQNCVKTLLARGKDPMNHTYIWELAEELYVGFIAEVEARVHAIRPGLPIFHNGGHVQRGRLDFIAGDTHLELESLPTGGWGYDHFPLSALYVAGLGLNYLGMTGRFHKAWGEFGGYKHPNALIYETSLNLVYGARCSVGDQLHPSGALDSATYHMIGSAYERVEQKERYLEGTSLVADIGLLSLEALGARYGEHNLLAIAEADTLGEEYDVKNHISQAKRSDEGALRLLSEGGYLFRVIDAEMDFSPFAVLVLPDEADLDEQLAHKLAVYRKNGGKVFLTGRSGIVQGKQRLFDELGFSCPEPETNIPVYIRTREPLDALDDNAFVVYEKAYCVQADETCTKILADFEYPYFNRSTFEFCSHAHAPSQNRCEAPAIIAGDGFVYAAFHMFEEYRVHGAFLTRELFCACMNRLLGEQKTLVTSMPPSSTVTLMRNEEKGYDLVQLLYAPMLRKGEDSIVIEELLPVYDVSVSIKPRGNVKSVRLVPQETEIPFAVEQGLVSFCVDKVECHAMVQVLYER